MAFFIEAKSSCECDSVPLLFAAATTELACGVTDADAVYEAWLFSLLLLVTRVWQRFETTTASFFAIPWIYL